MDRRVINSLRGMNERNRFLRGMVPWVGFRQIGVEYHREARYAGEAKFTSVKKMLPFALDAITSFSYFPLQLATIFGFVMAAISAIAILAVVLVRRRRRVAACGVVTTPGSVPVELTETRSRS